MSSPPRRVPLAPRLVILAGVLAFSASVFLKPGPSLQAVLQLGGGLVALAGLAWFLIALRRGRA